MEWIFFALSLWFFWRALNLNMLWFLDLFLALSTNNPDQAIKSQKYIEYLAARWTIAIGSACLFWILKSSN